MSFASSTTCTSSKTQPIAKFNPWQRGQERESSELKRDTAVWITESSAFQPAFWLFKILHGFRQVRFPVQRKRPAATSEPNIDRTICGFSCRHRRMCTIDLTRVPNFWRTMAELECVSMNNKLADEFKTVESADELREILGPVSERARTKVRP